MNVITLDDEKFERVCVSLANKIKEYGEPLALVGVRNGGAVVARHVFDHLAKENKGLRYFEAGASRKSTTAKSSAGIKNVLSRLPSMLSDWLRLMEYYLVSLRMRLFQAVDRAIKLDSDLLDYITTLDSGRLFIIDDAIDSGATVKNLLDEPDVINPALEYKVAVIVVTQKKPLIHPDVSVFDNILLRYPWSNDYKKK